MWSRLKKVARLDREGVLQLKANKDTTGQSVAVLVFAALSIGIGSTVLFESRSNSLSPYGIIVGSLTGLVSGCFAGFVWSAMTFLVGTKLFQGKTSYWELARPLFFSAGPSFLFILLVIPFYPLQVIVTLVAAVWVVVAQGFVLKQVMGFNIQRTLLTIAVGLLVLTFIELQFL
jgi:Yip1 domain